jgi:hypothetical protein
MTESLFGVATYHSEFVGSIERVSSSHPGQDELDDIFFDKLVRFVDLSHGVLIKSSVNYGKPTLRMDEVPCSCSHSSYRHTRTEPHWYVGARALAFQNVKAQHREIVARVANSNPNLRTIDIPVPRKLTLEYGSFEAHYG